MKTNRKTKTPPVYTHGGGKADKHVTVEDQLRRSVMATMLWEDQFYEDGVSIAKRIEELIPKVPASVAAAIAVEARTVGNLRHVPLLIAATLAKTVKGNLVGETIEKVVQRADELAEFLAIYAKVNGVAPSAVKKKLSAQVKKGLARAFTKFDEYQLAKYDRAGDVRLRDALFLVHAKPKDAEQDALWKRLIDGKMVTPDTWETELSAGKDKKATFTRLLKEGKLGYMALLRNLRNMEQAGVDSKLVNDAIRARKGAHRVLPFRFIAAAKAAPKFEPALDEAMVATLAQAPKLKGKTVVIIDVSGSMYGSTVSAKSDMDRARAACALAAIMREVCEEPVIYATAGSDGNRKHKTELVPARRGMALVDAIYDMCHPLGGGGIFVRQVMDYIAGQEKDVDRVVMITDEQDTSGEGDSFDKANLFAKGNHYMINVGSYEKSVGYGKWVKITGFSEAVVKYITAMESNQQ